MTIRPIIFFGTEAFSAVSLEALLDKRFPVVGVVTKPDRPQGRGRTLEAPKVKTLAERHGVKVWQPDRLGDIAAELMATGATAGVVVAYGKIIPKNLIEYFSDGLVNVHASLLPKYRGASPIEHALLNGDTQTGVTLMRIEPGLDTGPMFAKVPLPLSGRETRPEVYAALAERGAQLLLDQLPAILNHQLAPTPQNDAAASVARLLTKQDGRIDWNEPAERIERQVRAFLGWPGSRTQLAGTDVVITASHVGDTAPLLQTQDTGAHPGKAFKTDRGELAVVSGHGELIIDRLIPAGKAEMTGRAFMNGRSL